MKIATVLVWNKDFEGVSSYAVEQAVNTYVAEKRLKILSVGSSQMEVGQSNRMAYILHVKLTYLDLERIARVMEQFCSEPSPHSDSLTCDVCAYVGQATAAGNCPVCGGKPVPNDKLLEFQSYLVELQADSRIPKEPRQLLDRMSAELCGDESACYARALMMYFDASPIAFTI